MSDKTKSVSDATFESEVLKASGPVLVDFYADWCGPCKTMSPLIDELSASHAGKIKVLKMNVEESPHTPGKYGIRGIPTFIIFKDGKQVDSRATSMPKEKLVQWVESVV